MGQRLKVWKALYGYPFANGHWTVINQRRMRVQQQSDPDRPKGLPPGKTLKGLTSIESRLKAWKVHYGYPVDKGHLSAVTHKI